MYRLMGQIALRRVRQRSLRDSSSHFPPLQSLPSHRTFASQYYKLKRKKKGPDPFAVLGVSTDDSYKAVKAAFLQIAMQHHPDTTLADTDEKKEEHREIFVKAQTAFETLIEGPNGNAILREDSDKAWDEAEIDQWFREETGHDMPFMDAATMKEVAEVTKSMGADAGGLDRDGGMWTLARMVTENVKKGGDGKDILALEAGTVRDRAIDGVL